MSSYGSETIRLAHEIKKAGSAYINPHPNKEEGAVFAGSERFTQQPLRKLVELGWAKADGAGNFVLTDYGHERSASHGPQVDEVGTNVLTGEPELDEPSARPDVD